MFLTNTSMRQIDTL